MPNITLDYVKNHLPIRKFDAYKANFGRVLCIGGNHEMGGAIMLAAGAALHTGAGLVTIASNQVNRTSIHARMPEIMFADMSDLNRLTGLVSKMDIILIGPGLGRSEEASHIFNTVMQSMSEKQYLVIDADGLSFYKKYRQEYTLSAKKIILTPHLGEWEMLTGIKANEEHHEINKIAQELLGAIVVLKKARTEIYYDDEVWTNTSGNPAMATGGMGDTLAGMITGFLGQYTDATQAINSAVFLHSYIADQFARNQYVTLPSRIIERIPMTMKDFIKGKIR